MPSSAGVMSTTIYYNYGNLYIFINAMKTRHSLVYTKYIIYTAKNPRNIKNTQYIPREYYDNNV